MPRRSNSRRTSRRQRSEPSEQLLFSIFQKERTQTISESKGKFTRKANENLIAHADPKLAGETRSWGEGATRPPAKRRIAAIHLPQILCEMARTDRTINSLNAQPLSPLGVVLVDSDTDEIRPADSLNAICPKAHRAGVRVGNSSIEARALLSDLKIESLQRSAVEAHLVALAEVLKPYGTTISWKSPDTLWLDVTGVAHLFGGEKQLAEEIHEQVRLMGHVVRVVFASGPQVAQAIARYTPQGIKLIAPENTKDVMCELPLSALPLEKKHLQWLSRLGLFSIGQLSTLPAKAFSTRLGSSALAILDLARGIDPTVLVPGQFPSILSEEIEWEDAVEGVSPLLFAINRLIVSLSARLVGRGEATAFLEIELVHDRAMSENRHVAPQTILEFQFAAPLLLQNDLQRVVKVRLESLRLAAPTTKIILRAKELTPHLMDQLKMSATCVNENGPLHSSQTQQLSVLLAEIQSDVGAECLGVLNVQNGHRPETHSVLQPIVRSALSSKTGKQSTQLRPSALSERVKSSFQMTSKKAPQVSSFSEHCCSAMTRVTRILPSPQIISTTIRVGECFGLGGELYTIESLKFIQRLDKIDWWSPHTVSRDYVWAWLKSPAGGTEALLFFDRITKNSYVQALFD